MSVLNTHERPRHVHIITGPEGGFTQSEVADAQHAGAHIVSLGPTIVRAETAPIIALSTINSFFWRNDNC